MDMFRNSDGFEQRLLVTFRARSLDLVELAQDVMRELPSARFRCGGNPAQTDAGKLTNVVDVGIELPDDAALLNGVMAVIFHGQGDLQPKLKVRRVLAERPGQAEITRSCASIPAAFAAAA